MASGPATSSACFSSRRTRDATSTDIADVKGAGDRSGGDDNGGTLEDPYAALLGSSETLVAENENVSSGNSNARMTYTVPTDAGGVHYIHARAASGTPGSDGTYIRTYTVSVAEVARLR